MLYIGASPGGLPAGEASPSRQPAVESVLPPLSPYLRAARIGHGPVRYTPPILLLEVVGGGGQLEYHLPLPHMTSSLFFYISDMTATGPRLGPVNFQ